MAKKSAIEKNETRIKKVSLMGNKRKALKKIIMNKKLLFKICFNLFWIGVSPDHNLGVTIGQVHLNGLVGV